MHFCQPKEKKNIVSVLYIPEGARFVYENCVFCNVVIIVGKVVLFLLLVQNSSFLSEFILNYVKIVRY